MVKLSVIVPVYNVEKYLEQCLNSIINQTLSDIEIICIDDGSTDNSLAILEEYAQKDSRIKVYTQKNKGQGVARNKGMEISQGEYLGFVDPDDWIELNMFETLYSKAKKFDCDIVEAMYSEFYEYSGRTKVRKSPVALPENQPFNWNVNKEYLFKSSILAVWNKIYKKEFIRNNNIRFADTRLAEDHIFTLKSKILADRIAFLNESYYHYRVRKNSAVNRISADTLDVIGVLEDVREFFNTQGVQNESNRNEFEAYYEFSLARLYVSVPCGYRELYDYKCRNFLTEKQYRKYQQFKLGRYRLPELIFSLKNETLFGIRYKVLMLLGCKIKFKTI